MHHTIASRSFRFVGPLGKPIQGVHDTITGAVYTSIRVGAAALGAVIDRSSARSAPNSGNAIVSFVNAVWGDDLGRHEGRVSIDMAITSASGTPATHFDSAERATGHLVVLVHGLGQTDASWRNDDTPDLVDRIAAHDHLTPLLVRYNTGRSVAANGRDLAAWLESTVAAWPVAVERVTIVGHSLGGLVARSACLTGHQDEHTWPDHVGDLITTGTPHAGAPAEKAANVAAWGLGFSRVTQPLASFVNRRSRGIKDLRFGAILDSDWGDDDPDALLRNATAAHRIGDHIAHHAIATTVTGAVDGPAAWLFGDGMVRTKSATNLRGSQPASTSVTGAVAHFAMQRHEVVLDSIMDIVVPPTPQ
jgi:pimeloyl-ACP methyl ester carboxylesterase